MKFKEDGCGALCGTVKDGDGDAVSFEVFKGRLDRLSYRLVLRVNGQPVGLTGKQAKALRKTIKLAEREEAI